MSCEYLDWRGSIFGSYYCKKKDNYIDNDIVRKYCEGIAYYKDCPIFKKSDSSCYLTTAMCKVLGKEDDCFELETLRQYRDSYMKHDEKFDPALEDYNKIGPIISEKIMNDENKEQIALIMKYIYIDRAIFHIANNENIEAYNVYLDMTIDLMENYGIDQSLLNPKCFEISSHARSRKRKNK